MAGHTVYSFLVLAACLFIIGRSRTVSRVEESVGSIDVPIYEDPGGKKPFSLEEIYLYLYAPSSLNGTWMSDNEIMVVDPIKNDITSHNVVTGEKTTIFNGTTLPMEYKYSTASLSASKENVLFSYNIKRVFRHSTLKNCVVHNVKRGTFEKVANGTRISLAMWSPIGNELIYVRNNDIYHMNFKDRESEVRRLTSSGKAGVVFNGIPDWVYEEEVFASPTAIWYSPDGRYLAFATFNDTRVMDMEYSHYGTPGSLRNQYPIQVKLKYPKAGTPNPIVSLSVIDLADSSEAVTLKAPIDVVGSDHILYTVSWWNQTHIAATWTNRVQNQSQLVIYDTQGTGKLIWYDEEREGWLQPNSPTKVGNYALLLRREDSGTSAGRFRHIVRYEHDGGQFTSPVDLTPGPSEVHSILAVDANRGRVYYLATAPGKPTQRNLYSVPLDVSQNPTCISCEQLTPEGNKCNYATASFSSYMSHYALICTGPDLLTVRVHDVDADHRRMMTWEDNWLTRSMLSYRLMPLQKDFNVTVNGYNVRVRLLLPPDFDEKKSYPMLVNVYGGPNSVKITDFSKIGYEHYLTTNKRVIHMWIDGRGSAYKGSEMLFEIYRRMGTVEVEDTIAVTKILQERYRWIDPDRIGIWGWSYGGFTTAMVLVTDKEFVFKCGISVAPVTSWIYYDSVFTERIMGMPSEDDNQAGYNNTDISRRARGIRGKKFMLIHGTGDDNVHYQQAMMFAKMLERQDIMFEQVSYPDEVHSLLRVQPHFYHTMDKFWNECFRLPAGF
ncbi:venom dipeptidyl peptidase 4-like isoform X2 [Odontomachus brunneus]|uniref:venom dipeptidyl peptidase 4-like isoform X2 n=1 Tax=Odontomachus brunneus TaxID=486640 RepID=UPI0013F241A4|nr:venom dipeptidyl peptidase 4-like isoform X2 [Odontomachus brunneus]